VSTAAADWVAAARVTGKPKKLTIKIKGCETGLGLGLDPSNIVTLLEPDRPASDKSKFQSKAQLRLCDVVLNIDGKALNGRQLKDVIKLKNVHTFEVERFDAKQEVVHTESSRASVGEGVQIMPTGERRRVSFVAPSLAPGPSTGEDGEQRRGKKSSESKTPPRGKKKSGKSETGLEGSVSSPAPTHIATGDFLLAITEAPLGGVAWFRSEVVKVPLRGKVAVKFFATEDGKTTDSLLPKPRISYVDRTDLRLPNGNWGVALPSEPKKERKSRRSGREQGKSRRSTRKSR